MLVKNEDNYYIHTASGVMCLGSNPTLQSPTFSNRVSEEAYIQKDQEIKTKRKTKGTGAVGLDNILNNRRIFPMKGKGLYPKGSSL